MATSSDTNSHPASDDSNGGKPDIILRLSLNSSEDDEYACIPLGNVNASKSHEIKDHKFRPAPDGTSAAEWSFSGTEIPGNTSPKTITTTVKPGDYMETDDFEGYINIEGTQEPPTEYWIPWYKTEIWYNPESRITRQMLVTPGEVHSVGDGNSVSIHRIEPNELGVSVLSSKDSTIRYLPDYIPLKGATLSGFTTYDSKYSPLDK